MIVAELSHQAGHLHLLAKKLQYRHRMTHDDYSAVLGLQHSVKQLGAHDYIVREGDASVTACLLLSGFAIRHKIVAGGLRQILAIHMPGEMVDLQNSFLGHADHHVQMLTEGRVALLPVREVVRVAFDYPNVGKALWLDTLVDASIFREWIANVGRRDARARMAHLLCEFSLRLKVAGLGEPDNYEMPMTQEQLADATGLTPVHVNRTLKALERDGLIVRRSARVIEIGDWRKLAEAGDFSSAYLHLDIDEPALA